MIRLAAVVVTVLMAANATAQTMQNELTVFGGYRFGGSFDVTDSDASYDADDDASFGLIWNHKARANTQYEVYFATESTRAELEPQSTPESVVDLDLTTLELGGTYLWDGELVQPFLSMTLGATHIESQSSGPESDVFLSGSLGLGLRIAPTSRVGLRLEARMHGIFTQKSTDLFCQTGPAQSGCAFKVDATVFGQLETLAGIVVRF